MCAVTMATACVIPSVGAINAPATASKEIIDGVNELNADLTEYSEKLKGVLKGAEIMKNINWDNEEKSKSYIKNMCRS